MAKHSQWRLIKITRSPQKGKKWQARFQNRQTGRFKTTHFGARGMSDFTKHRDRKRKERYLTRHRKRENWLDPTTPGALSRWILWEKPTFKGSLREFKKKFGL